MQLIEDPSYKTLSERVFRAAIFLVVDGRLSDDEVWAVLHEAALEQREAAESWTHGCPEQWTSLNVANARAYVDELAEVEVTSVERRSLGPVAICKILTGPFATRWVRPPIERPGSSRHDAWCRACGVTSAGEAKVHSGSRVRMKVELGDDGKLRGVRVYPPPQARGRTLP